MATPVPVQTRTVDPFASYNSNVVNVLTRIVTGGNDTILGINPVEITRVDNDTLRCNPGMVIKDDVLIELNQHDIQFTDNQHYVNQVPGIWNEAGYHYIVLEYVYIKSKPAPEASIKIIRPSERTNPSFFNTTSHILLKVVDVVDSGGYKILNDEALKDLDPENTLNFVQITEAGESSVTEVADSVSNYNVRLNERNVSGHRGTNISLLKASTATKITIINMDTDGDPTNSSLTITPYAGDTIEGKSSIELPNVYDSVTLLPIGDTWVEI